MGCTGAHVLHCGQAVRAEAGRVKVGGVSGAKRIREEKTTRLVPLFLGCRPLQLNTPAYAKKTWKQSGREPKKCKRSYHH